MSQRTPMPNYMRAARIVILQTIQCFAYVLILERHLVVEHCFSISKVNRKPSAAHQDVSHLMNVLKLLNLT